MADLDLFKKKFKTEPLYRIITPSRVNLIGEHVDYFGLYVLPMAIKNAQMVSLVTPRKDFRIHIYSENLGSKDEPEVIFTTRSKRQKVQWAQYIQGAITEYQKILKTKNLKGFDLLLNSNIPMGGGLSSSSALTMTALIALGLANKFPQNNLKASLKQLCLMGCYAEWWYGTKGGAMDHFAVTVSLKNHATLLDNSNFSYQYIPLPKQLSFIICNTKVSHNQLFNQFADRKKDAYSALEKIKKLLPEVKTVKDLTLEKLEQVKNKLTDQEYRRIKHPVTEKKRVFDFIEALEKKDFITLGKIANQAFYSLKDDYEVSCLELDIMQQAAIDAPGCFGARITGGGFGGCIIAFVDSKKKDQFIKSVKQKYNDHPKIKKEGIVCDIWEAQSSGGLTVEALI